MESIKLGAGSTTFISEDLFKQILQWGIHIKHGAGATLVVYNGEKELLDKLEKFRDEYRV